ncbi:MAG: class I SAM-dependent methyltransferase [Anaerolineae bacterium]|nr:class I SAM-dependent methyltransferase [Anaerolineae bacterium]
MPRKDLHEDNRISWNAATEAHNSHKRDQATFLRNGGSTLFPEEIELLGDLHGKSLLHLQCNAGQDTLSLARLGTTVTGVDISDTAVEFARFLSAETGIPATFERSDICDWMAATDSTFDGVFSSYGALVWLSDLQAWGRGIARVLKPGGRVVVLEFHPMFNAFEEGWRLTYDYMGGAQVTFAGVGDYIVLAGDVLTPSGFQEGVVDFKNPHPSHEFCWGVADVVMPLIDAGLRLATLREYPYSNGFKRFSDMRALPGGRFVMPEGMPQIPMMLGVVADKPAL